MRSLIILLVSVTASFAHADSVKIDNKAPKKGAKWTQEKSSVAKFTVETKGKSMPMVITEIERKTIEVLDTKADLVTKAKITYVKKSKSRGDKPTTDPLEGKTFTLTAGEPVVVEPETDADAVRRAESRFGKPDRIRAAVGGREYTKGMVIDISNSAANDMFGEDTEVTKFTLEYSGMDGKNPKFKVQLEASTKVPIPMKVVLGGTVVLDPATADSLSIDLTGTMKSTGGDTKLDGTMTMSGHRVM